MEPQPPAFEDSKNKNAESCDASLNARTIACLTLTGVFPYNSCIGYLGNEHITRNTMNSSICYAA